MNLKISLLLFKQDDTAQCTFTRDSRSTELGIYNSSDMSFLLISRGRTLLS